MRKLLCISYLGHKTNDWVRSKINFLGSSQEPLLATIKRQQLAWFGHVTRHDSLSKTSLQDTLEVGRRRGRQSKLMLDGQRQRVDIPAHAGTAHYGLLEKRLEEDLC